MKKEFQIISELIENNTRVLDVGCGDGVLMQYLKDKKNIDTRGLEISKNNVQNCTSKGLSVIEGNAEKDLYQFPNLSFDYVVLSQTLQAFYNPEKVIDDLLKVANKAIVTIPNFGHWKVRIHLLLKGTMPVTKILPHEWYNTPNLHMCTIKDFFNFCSKRKIELYKSIALSGEKISKINSKNINIKNLNSELGIFLIKNKMKIEIIPCLKDNYSYVIIDENNKKTCVIDPSESRPIINFLEKNNLKLNYILNTHHHYDHVGGNSELKKKYKSKVVGFIEDYKRIPEIDNKIKDEEIWKEDNFEAKVMHIPGHTLGHICFYFYKDNNLFTGDTLFSLGCGRIFEGTYEQMFSSLEKIKKLPPKTKIYCGHEYTLQNSKFCIQYDKENQNLIKKIKDINEKLKNNKPTIPSTIEDELKNNIFLRSNNENIKTNLNIGSSSPLITFSKLRDLKDNF